MNSLKSAIVPDPALLQDLESYKKWFERYGQSAPLKEVADKFHDAQHLVSEYTSYFSPYLVVIYRVFKHGNALLYCQATFSKSLSEWHCVLNALYLMHAFWQGSV